MSTQERQVLQCRHFWKSLEIEALNRQVKWALRCSAQISAHINRRNSVEHSTAQAHRMWVGCAGVVVESRLEEACCMVLGAGGNKEVGSEPEVL